jgi:hypothetical protein
VPSACGWTPTWSRSSVVGGGGPSGSGR